MNIKFFNKHFLLLLISTIINPQFAFPQTVDFIRHYSQLGKTYYTNHIIHTSDKGYVIIGSQNYVFTGSVDNYFIAKTDSAGDTLWYREDNFPYYTEAKFVIETSDSCYIIGTTKNRIGLAKYDRYGNFLWEKGYNPVINWIPGSIFNFSSLIEINESIYAFGYMNLPGNFLSEGIMMKLNLNGDSILVLNNTPFTCGRSIHAVSKHDTNKIAVCGYVYDSTLTKYQLQLSIIDTNGNVLLNQIYPTANTATGLLISEADNHGFYIMSEGSSGSVYKTDSLGNVLWSRVYSTDYFCKIDDQVLLMMDDDFSYYYLNDSGYYIVQPYFDLQFTTLPPHIAGVILVGNKLIIGGSSKPPASNTGEWFIVQYELSQITSLPETEFSAKFLIYPNPLVSPQNNLFIKSFDTEIKTLQFYNLYGQIIKTIINYGKIDQFIEVDLTGFTKGIYFIKVIAVDNKNYTRKFIIN